MTCKLRGHWHWLRSPANKLALIEVLLLGERLADGKVNSGEALQVVVVQIPIWRSQSVDPSGRLRRHLVRILL